MPKKVKNTSKKKKRAVENAAQHKEKTNTIRVTVSANVDQDTLKKKKNKVKKEKKHNTAKVQAIKPEKKKVRPKKISNSRYSKKVFKWIGLVLFIAAATVFLFTTPLFNVTEIEVLGNDIVNSEEIKSLSQITLQENMFKNVKSVIRQNIKGNAYIENVEIKRILPNKIQIIVDERKVKFIIKLLNKYAYINSQGYILEISEQTKEVPIIEGISTPEEEIAVGKRLNTEDLKSLETVLKIISECEENEISRFITSINIKNTNEYKMYLAEKNKTVHLGNSYNIPNKILFVKAILEAEEGNEGDIFVNGDLTNGFQPYFRKKV